MIEMILGMLFFLGIPMLFLNFIDKRGEQKQKSKVHTPNQYRKIVAAADSRLAKVDYPVRLHQREEFILALVRREGWTYAGGSGGQITFLRTFDAATIHIGISKMPLATFGLVECRIVPSRNAPPEGARAHVEGHQDLFAQLFNSAHMHSPGTFVYDGETFDGPVVGILRYCMNKEALTNMFPDSFFFASHLKIEDGEIAVTLAPCDRTPASQLLQIDIANRWNATLDAFRRVMRMLPELAEAMAWEVSGPADVIDAVLEDRLVEAELWRVMATKKLAGKTEEQRIAWLNTQVTADATRPSHWSAIVPMLFALDPTTRRLSPLFEHAFLPDNFALLQLIFEAASQQQILSWLEGPERVRWLNALLHPSIRSTSGRIQMVIKRLDPSYLLWDGLSAAGRGFLLSGLLANQEVSDPVAVITTLLKQTDDEDLVEILTTLSVYANENVAKVIASFAKNPEQIDTSREYQAMLMLFKNLSREHAGVLRTQDVEAFLCECVKHPDERIASMALSLLETLGEDFAVKRLTQLLGEEVVVPSAMLTRTSREIRKRMGEDMNTFAGGLSIAAAAGGELTQVTGEGGALTIHTDGGA